MSYKPVVRVIGKKKWYDNACRFLTQEEAENAAHDLFNRWAATDGHRAEQSDDPVNYVYDKDGERPIKK